MPKIRGRAIEIRSISKKKKSKKKIQAIKEQVKKSAKWAAKIEGCSLCGRNQAKKEQAGVERTKLYIQPWRETTHLMMVQVR